MTQPFSLQPLLNIMQERTDEATRKLGQLLAAEQNEKSRLQMLEQYRAEYAARMNDATSQGVTLMVLRNYQEFLARIDDAISAQRQAVQNSENNTRAGQEAWKTQNKQLKALDTLSQRHDVRQRYREGKQEQKLQDEFSTHKFSGKEPQDT